MSATKEIPKITKAKKSGIRCEFKPAQQKRSIKHASPDQVKKASKWSIQKYNDLFKILAQ